MAKLRTERGLDRIVNFTDAAVAISLTLLVLPIVDIGSKIHTDRELWHAFDVHSESFLAFAISFAVIGNLWLVHHRNFEFVADYDHTLAIINLFWLFTIACLPFSTNIIANGGGYSGIIGLYLTNVFLASAFSLLMRFYISRRPGLVRPESASELHVLAMVVPSAIILLATILAILVPTVGPLWLLLMFGGAPIERAIINREKKKQAQQVKS